MKSTAPNPDRSGSRTRRIAVALAATSALLVTTPGVARLVAPGAAHPRPAVPAAAAAQPTLGAGLTFAAEPDPFPAATAFTAAAALSQRAIPCRGDGSSGNRIAFYYAYLAGSAYRLPLVRAKLTAAIKQANDLVYRSARESGGYRWLRVLTNRLCTPIITPVRLPASAAGEFSATLQAARRAGMNALNRKYVLLMDTNRLCGVGTLAYDDRPGLMNSSNTGPSWARVDRGCWSGEIIAHEIFHLLGAVQKSAPHFDNSGHCTDDHDLLCYQNAGGKRVYVRCRAQSQENRLDCAKDDYFNTNPRRGSYLATHWNTAASSFLYGGGPARPALPGVVPPIQVTMPTLSSAVLTWTAPSRSRVTSYTVLKNGSPVWHGTGTTWTDVDAMSAYSGYQVLASNEAGDGPSSASVAPVLPLPPAPAAVSASGTSPTTIAWGEGSTALIAGFRIYGLQQYGTRYLGSMSADYESATDWTALRYKTWTRYRVCAYNNTGEACTDQS